MNKPTPGYTLYRCRECGKAYETKPIRRPRKAETIFCWRCQANTKHDTGK